MSGLGWKIEVEAKPLGERVGVYVPVSLFQTIKRICASKNDMVLIEMFLLVNEGEHQ